MVVDLFELHALQDLCSQLGHLLNELWSQILNTDGVQALQIALIDDRSNHGVAISLWKELPYVLLYVILAACLILLFIRP